eukprot:SAG22_NODE_9179_length_605_cov_0.810277_1_plen_98_part_00
MKRLKKGDKVKVISGRDKGETGEIEKVLTKKNQVIVKGINVVSKTRKPTNDSKGGIVKISKGIDSSNVMLILGKSTTPTKVKFDISTNSKQRIAKKK